MEELKAPAQLITIKEVCSVLQVSRYTVYRWIRDGKLDKIELPGGIIRVTMESVQRVINDGKG